MLGKAAKIHGACLCIVLSLTTASLMVTGCSNDHQVAYSQNFSSLETAADFNLGSGESYYEKLEPGEESVLLFWGSWCPHCESLIESIDHMEQSEIVKSNLFTVAEDERAEDVESHLNDFPIYLDQNEEVYRAFKLEHIPTVFVVNDQGGILASAQGEKDSMALLQEYASRN